MKLVELFACAGGIASGAHQAGFETVWATDMDPIAAATFKHNFPNTNYVVEDIASIDLNNLPEFDGLAFGSPCNDFSMIGRRKGLTGKYGSLYLYGRDVLEIHQPKFFLFENVKGLLSKGIDVVRQDLEAAGYDLFQHLYDFSLYGVPQKRHRVIIVGFRKDLQINFQHPAPTTRTPVTVRQAISNIPTNALNHELPVESAPIQARLNCIKPGENIWHAQDAGRVPAHLRIKDRARISQVYRREHWDRPAFTLTAKGGGGCKAYHPTAPRALSIRERARLQSFPDNFEFIGSFNQCRSQIGMSVPPLGMKIVFEAIRDALASTAPPCPIHFMEWDDEF